MNTKQSNFLELQIGDNSTYFDVTSGYPIKNRKINIENISKLSPIRAIELYVFISINIIKYINKNLICFLCIKINTG